MAKKELLLGAVAAGLLLSGASAPAFAAKGEGKHHQRHAAMIERLDADKNGKVSLDEFKTNAAAAFKTFDADGNGQVTKDEIKARREAFKDARKAVHDAAEADKVRPVSIKSIAAGAPTSRGRRALPPQPGTMPNWVSGRPMRVETSFDATR